MTKESYWIVRKNGIVIAALSERGYTNDKELLDDLREFAETGPVERITTDRRVIIGESFEAKEQTAKTVDQLRGEVEKLSLWITSPPVENSLQLILKWIEEHEQPSISRFVPTEQQRHSACLTFHHDYGVMTEEEKQKIRYQADEWLAIWQQVIKEE